MTTENKSHSPHSLESLVPPLDLCKQIPAGAFEDSVLVWFGVKNHDSTMEVVPRLELGGTCKMFLKKGIRVLFPAPTLQETLYKLRNLSIYNEIEWIADCKLDPETWLKTCKDANPANAALKLWFELNHTR